MPLVPANARLRRTVSAFLALGIGLACLFATDSVVHFTGYDRLTDVTTTMLDNNIGRDMKTFMAVSGIKAGMAIFTGSTVEAGFGVGVELEVGDAVQPVYDYIDFVWKMLLYALMVLGFYKLLLETGILVLGLKMAGVGLVVWGLTALSPSRHEPLRRWGRAFVVLGLLFAYVVPGALWATQYLSDHYTAKLKAKHYAQIETFHREFDRFKERTLALKDKMSVLRPGQSIDEVRTTFASAGESLAASSKASLMAFLYYILITLFELLFLPFLSAFLLYKFLQTAISEVLGAGTGRRQAEFAPDPEPRAT